MTERRPTRSRIRRRHAAFGARILTTGISLASVLGLVAGWAAAPQAPSAAPSIRAVVTDGRVAPEVAARAAVEAAAAGRTRTQVQITAGSQRTEVAVDATSRAS